MNQIIYPTNSKTYTFTDEDILWGNVNIGNGMIGETLATDTIEFEIHSESVPWLYLWTVDNELYAPYGYDSYAISTGEDLSVYDYGSPITYYHDGELVGKFYIQTIDRTGAFSFKFTAVSLVGLLDNVNFYGRIYTGVSHSPADTVGSTIEAIMSTAGFIRNMDYTIDADVAKNYVNGLIKYGSAREALQNVLYECGATLMKDENGVPRILFNHPAESTAVEDSGVYLGGSNNYLLKATKITVVEHSFIAADGTESEVLFDNTTTTIANHDRIIFDWAYHSYTTTGTLTINESSDNYCVVTGTGTLSGKPYVDNQRELTWENPDDTLQTNEIIVKEAYLVSQSNATNVLARAVNYYSNADELNYSIVASGNIRPGTLVEISDQYNYDKVTGIIKESNLTMSATLKSDATIVTNWNPSNLGDSYTHSVVITKADLVGGVYNVPAAARGHAGLLVLFGGMGGGQGGYNGQESQPGVQDTTQSSYYYYGGQGGNGGSGGQAGARGKTLTANIASLANSYSVSFGDGGLGGAANGGLGSAGGDSTFGVYSTANGLPMQGAYRNFLTGQTYGNLGNVGYTGAKGGKSVDFLNEGTASDETKGDNGGSIGSWTGGQGCIGYTDRWFNPSGYDDGYESDNCTDRNFGLGGGGAAWGSNGGNAVRPSDSLGSGTAGRGADAVAPSQAQFTTGHGGNGGGGAGGCGIAYRRLRTGRSSYRYTYYHTTGRNDGGNGSQGGKGSDGFAILYYSEE